MLHSVAKPIYNRRATYTPCSNAINIIRGNFGDECVNNSISIERERSEKNDAAEMRYWGQLCE